MFRSAMEDIVCLSIMHGKQHSFSMSFKVWFCFFVNVDAVEEVCVYVGVDLDVVVHIVVLVGLHVFVHFAVLIVSCWY